MSNILLFASRTCAGSLLSPPSSPQMSRRALEFDETNFEAAWMASEQNSSAFAENRNSRSVDSLDSHKQPPCASGRPILGLHEGFFSSTRSTGNMKEESSEPANQSTISSTIEGWRPSSDVIGLVKADAKNGLPGSKLNRLGPDSFPRFIPDTAFTNPEDELDYDEEYAMTASDQDEHMNEGGVSKTTSEEPVNKRKMKRFRLTHSQTRFLQSEFARQAHPDAAQRERLSREIPGLSPRQVQVWFQNRRAKMKRLTSEDQERVMRSRALPETFHDIDGLHSGHSRQSQYFGDSSIVHPSQTINDEGSFYQGLRRRNGGSLAGYPLSVKSNLDELHRGSGPTLASEMMSPISLTHDSPQLPPSSTTNLADLLPISSASRSRSFPLINQSQPFSPNLKFQDQSSRRRAGSLASPQGMDWHSSEGLWDRTTSQVTGLGISSSATTMFDNSYVNGPDAVRVPENFHFSSVQNVYAPEIHLSMPSDGQWHGARHSVPSPNANNLLALSSDLNTQLTAESLASYSNLYHPSLPREESLHVQQNFPTPQAAIPCQSMTREAQFPVNYSGDISQEFQPLPMRELGTEELSISPYHTNSSFIP